MKQGTFKPCTSSRNAEEIEADASSGGKEDEADVNDDEDDDDDAIIANHSVDYIFGDENKENESDDDLEQEIYSEVEDNDIAPSKYSAYGNGDPLRCAKLLTGVCVEKKSGLGIVMGPRDLNRKVHNHACGTDEPLLRKDMVATAVRLASILITTQRVKIRDGRSQAEEYDLAANLDISEQNLTLKHQGWAQHTQRGAQYGRTYLEPYKKDIREMFDRGARVSTDKTSPCAMLESLQLLYPGRCTLYLVKTRFGLKLLDCLGGRKAVIKMI